MIKCNLAEIRMNHGLSQKKLSEICNIRHGTISEMESGKAKAYTIKNLNALCKALNCKISDLIEYSEDLDKPNTIQIKHCNQKVSAGIGYDLDDDDLWETIEVPENVNSIRADFALTVAGDSMTPDFNDGDIVLVKIQETIEEGEVGIFTVDGKGYIKKLGRNVLVSVNSKYEDIRLINTTNKCNGLVLGKI